MSRSTENLFMRPLFYDALSGEFSPKQDPLKRTHTLARLAVAAFTKGKELPGFGEDQLGLSYVPSWADYVEATAIAGKPFDSSKITLTGLVLATRRKEFELSFHDSLLPEGRGLTIVNDDDETNLPLELGDGLLEARAFVARAAQEFFDQAS